MTPNVSRLALRRIRKLAMESMASSSPLAARVAFLVEREEAFTRDLRACQDALAQAERVINEVTPRIARDKAMLERITTEHRRAVERLTPIDEEVTRLRLWTALAAATAEVGGPKVDIADALDFWEKRAGLDEQSLGVMATKDAVSVGRDRLVGSRHARSPLVTDAEAVDVIRNKVSDQWSRNRPQADRITDVLAGSRVELDSEEQASIVADPVAIDDVESTFDDEDLFWDDEDELLDDVDDVEDVIEAPPNLFEGADSSFAEHRDALRREDGQGTNDEHNDDKDDNDKADARPHQGDEQ